MEKKIFITENYGAVTLTQIGCDTYEVRDAEDDTYRGTITIGWNNPITDKLVSNKVNELYDYAKSND